MTRNRKWKLRGKIMVCVMVAALIATIAAAETESTATKSADTESADTESTESKKAETESSKAAAPSVVPPKVEPSRPEHKTPVNLAEKATDPSAILMQMQFQFFDTQFEDSDADQSKIVVQPVLPLTKGNVLRVTLPVLSTTTTGDRVQGLGDMVLADFFLYHTKSSSWGVGPVVSIPTATEDALGSGKWALGPEFLWIYKGIPKTVTGLLAQYLISVAGDSARSDVSILLFQPIYTRHTKWGYFGWSGQQMSYDFENSRYSIPIGAVFGKVFMAKKTPWNISVEPYYTVNQDQPDDWGIKLGWTAIFPKFHW